MNRKKLFEIVRNDYGRYIKYCVSRFCADENHTLDIIYQDDDIEQMVYINIWKYIGRYDKNKSSLKSYVIQIMQCICNQCLYLSSMQKRQPRKACSLNKEYINAQGDTITLEDTLIDNSLPNVDDNLCEFFYMQILKETHKRIYSLVKSGYTYKEIGKIFHVSRQRIGQIIIQVGRNIRKYEG